VLVATDVAARGVHVDDVELVIHVDPPMEHKAYLHRSGRTARAGAEGSVVTVVLPGQEKDVKDLLRKAAITATPVKVTPTSPEVTALVGEVAPTSRPRRSRAARPWPGRRRSQPGRERAAQARRARGRAGRSGRAVAGRGAGQGGQAGQAFGSAPRRAAPPSARPRARAASRHP
jgi:superfamily II DNA/RNA helicase